MRNAIRKLIDSELASLATILGCVASLVFALLLNWQVWPAVAVFAVLLFVIVIACVKGGNIPLSGQRFVDDVIARQSIGYGFSNISYPTCRVDAVSHAVGTVALASVAQNILEELVTMTRLIGNQVAELEKESDFSACSLVNHRTKIASLRDALDSLAKRWQDTDLPAAMGVKDENDPVFKPLLYAARILQVNVVEHIDDLLEKLPKALEWTKAPAKDGWGGDVANTLKNTVKKALGMLSESTWIPEVISNIEELVSKLKKDWNDDLEEVHGRPGCKPKPARTPGG